MLQHDGIILCLIVILKNFIWSLMASRRHVMLLATYDVENNVRNKCLTLKFNVLEGKLRAV